MPHYKVGTAYQAEGTKTFVFDDTDSSVLEARSPEDAVTLWILETDDGSYSHVTVDCLLQGSDDTPTRYSAYVERKVEISVQSSKRLTPKR